MNKYLLLAPVYLAFMLVSVNLLGADPADVIFVAIAVALLLVRPSAYTFPKVAAAGKIGTLLFLTFYAISCSFGYRLNFILYLVTGLAMALSASYYASRDPEFRVGGALFFGFILANLVAVILWAVGLWPESIFFELFRDGRYLGTMGDPNFIGLMAAFALYFLLDRLLRPQPNRAVLVLNGVATMLTLMMLLFSQSRSAWAAAVGGLVMQLIASRQIFAFRTVAAMFGVVGVGMVLAMSNPGGASSDVSSVSDRINTIFVQNDAAEQERFEFLYTRISLAVGLEHPLGVGPGMTFTYTGLLNIDGDPIGAHNAYVEILTENGWFAALTFVTLLAVAWLRLFRLARADVFLNDVSCRTILAGLTATGLFGMGHDLLGWRIGWIFPILAILSAFHVDFSAFRPLWTSEQR